VSGVDSQPGTSSTGERVREIAVVFSRLGLIAFGGPAAHIAMFEEEVVHRRGWVDRQRVLDLLGATQLIPGPNSTEMVIHLGYLRAGLAGLLVAGVAFLVPAALLSACLAAVYLRLGELPRFAPVLAGIQPVVVALIAAALFRLGQKALRTPALATVGLVAAVAAFLGLGPLATLLGVGVCGAVALRLPRARAAILLPLLAPVSAQAAATVAPSLVELGAVFLRVGAFLYGSGYVLVAFLERVVVEQHGWITQAQLLDAIAVGQLTPGPVLSTAAFIGYLLDGASGAVVATVAIFLPSFVYVLLLNPLIPRLRENPWTAAFLDAVNAAAVALIAVVALRLAAAAMTTPVAVAIGVLALAARFRGVSPVLLVVLGGIAGWLLL
jgi:chromate transporter